jgi:bacterioferritin-associated ferredoxin
MPGDPLICRCYRVHEAAIRQAIAGKSLTTVEQVSDETGAAAGCGSCHDDVKAILRSILGTPEEAAAAEPAIPIGELRIKVLDAMRLHVVPLLERNEVSVDVLGIEPGRVLARFQGRAVGTTLPSILTLKWYMVRILSTACGRKMSLIEMNIVEESGAFPPLLNS